MIRKQALTDIDPTKVVALARALRRGADVGKREHAVARRHAAVEGVENMGWHCQEGSARRAIRRFQSSSLGIHQYQDARPPWPLQSAGRERRVAACRSLGDSALSAFRHDGGRTARIRVLISFAVGTPTVFFYGVGPRTAHRVGAEHRGQAVHGSAPTTCRNALRQSGE